MERLLKQVLSAVKFRDPHSKRKLNSQRVAKPVQIHPLSHAPRKAGLHQDLGPLY